MAGSFQKSNLFEFDLNGFTSVKNIFNVVNVNASYMSGYHSTQSNSAMTGVGRTFFVAIRYQINKTN
jgi:hypothetical protein